MGWEPEGLRAPAEPLIADAPFTARITLPLPEVPERFSLFAWRVRLEDRTGLDERGHQTWNRSVDTVVLGPGPEVVVDLETGHYVLVASVIWEFRREVHYAFFIRAFE